LYFLAQLKLQIYPIMLSHWLRRESFKLFVQTGLKPRSSQSLPPKWLRPQTEATVHGLPCFYLYEIMSVKRK
jgi:hypothetical protein